MDQYSTPNQYQATPFGTTAPNSKKKMWLTIGGIVLVLIIAALVIFMTGGSEVRPITNTSDDISDIQADLEVSTEGLDTQNF